MCVCHGEREREIKDKKKWQHYLNRRTKMYKILETKLEAPNKEASAAFFHLLCLGFVHLEWHQKMTWGTENAEVHLVQELSGSTVHSCSKKCGSHKDAKRTSNGQSNINNH